MGHLPQIAKGSINEEAAIKQLVLVLSLQGHKDVVARRCGIFIDYHKQFLSASPDGIVSCTCCGDSLIELKCPTIFE